MLPADTLVVSARARTLDPARPVAHAVAVRGGTIAGLDDDALSLRGPGTRVIDLAGSHLTPGLVDGHCHPILGATAFVGTDLSGCATLQDLRACLAVAGRGLERGEWLRGYGLDHNVFAGDPIGNAVLHEVLPRVPVFIRLFDGHSALVSDEALRIAGVDGPRAFLQRATVVCDRTGRPTGHLREPAAMDLVTPHLPRLDRRQAGGDVLTLLRRMAATGLTAANVMDGDAEALELLRSIEQSADLPLRLRIAPWCMPGDDPDDLVAVQREHGRRWAVGAVKFFMDGTVDGGTAWLEQPDCHGQSTEPFWRDPAEYTKAVQQVSAAGVQTVTHAIGDAAVGHVLDALASIHGSGVRHRVEHLETLPLGLIRRLARSGLVASMQPSHAGYTKADHTDEWSTRLGPGGQPAPGAAETFVKRAACSSSALTGRSPTSTRAPYWPTPGTAARPAQPSRRSDPSKPRPA